MTPTRDPGPTPDHDDLHLLRSLRALPPDPREAESAAVERLQQRVMAQWAAGPGSPARAHAPRTSLAGGGQGPAGADGPNHGWRLLTAGLLVLLAVAAAVAGLQRTDPTIEELMRLDVLSQIAAGEL